MMKELFESARIEMIEFIALDVITASGNSQEPGYEDEL